MTGSHKNKLLKRINSNTCFDKMLDKELKKATIYKILECVDKRVFNRINQKYMSKACGVSIDKIKRFENLQVNDHVLIQDYICILEDLPNKIKNEIPKWVHN